MVEPTEQSDNKRSYKFAGYPTRGLTDKEFEENMKKMKHRCKLPNLTGIQQIPAKEGVSMIFNDRGRSANPVTRESMKTDDTPQ